MDMLAGFAGISDAADQLAVAVDRGFTISGSGAQALIDAVKEMQRDVLDALTTGKYFEQAPELGQTPAAQVYKPFMASIAADPVQGFLPYMKHVQEDLARVEDSLRKAMPSYQDSDQQGASSLGTAYS